MLISSPEAPAIGKRLEDADILVTPVGLPDELGGGCLRLGVQEITRRGFTPEQAPAVAKLIAAAWRGDHPADQISRDVAALVAQWQDWKYTWPVASS